MEAPSSKLEEPGEKLEQLLDKYEGEGEESDDAPVVLGERRQLKDLGEGPVFRTCAHVLEEVESVCFSKAL